MQILLILLALKISHKKANPSVGSECSKSCNLCSKLHISYQSALPSTKTTDPAKTDRNTLIVRRGMLNSPSLPATNYE